MMKALQLVFVIGVLGLTSSCDSNKGQKEEKSDTPLFSLISAEESGIDFVNTLESDPKTERNNLSFPHYYNGAGVAVGDINNDGLPDIFFSANEGKNTLYLNKGNFEFEDITEGSGLNPENKKWSTGAVMADVNADGFLDIYVCQAGYGLYPDRKDRENLLFINNGDGTFKEEAKAYGLNDSNESTSAAFFDYDKDGDLDVYVLNESIYAMMLYKRVFDDLLLPGKLPQASGKLFRNDGETFTNVTKEAGLLNYGFGLGLVVADLNDDSWPDIYVSNDYSVPNFMYINNGDGTFTDELNKRTRQVPFYSMGTDIADLNNDGYLDIVSVDMAANDHIRDKTLMASMDVEGFSYFVNTLGYQFQYMFNAMQLNNGNGTFSNIAGLSGTLRTEWSWAPLLIDLDNDGWKDYLVTNGYRKYTRDNDFRRAMDKVRSENGGSIPMDMRDEMYDLAPEEKSKNLVFRNNKDLSFEDVSDDWGLGELSYSTGAAYADFDQDGDMDLVINNTDHPSFLFKNNAVEQQKGNYLQFTFSDKSPEAEFYNARIWLYQDDQVQLQEFNPTRGYESSVEPIIHFGLGANEQVDRVVVQWAGGKISEMKNVAANQRIVLNFDEATEGGFIAHQSLTEPYFEEVQAKDLGIEFVHRENLYDDFKTEILLPHRQSTLGPKIAVGDVNNDELEDFYVGGAKGQPGALYIQNATGTFELMDVQPPWNPDFEQEDMGAAFIDANADGRQDLFVASGGGGAFKPGSELLNNRFYVNIPNPQQTVFAKANAFAAPMPSASNIVVPGDLDGDGVDELFIGGAAVPGVYPYPERSYILKLNNFKYTDITEQVAPDLDSIGIVKAAKWCDLNADGQLDLVLAGEWMPIKIYINNGQGQLTDQSEAWGMLDTDGWWYSLETADINGDGKEDLIVGNLGLNSKFSASVKKPFHIFASDFDDRGQVDIVLSKEYKGKLVPARGRQCSSDQMPFIKEKFETYQDFATADLEDIYGDDQLEQALHRMCKTFASAVFLNTGNGFERVELPTYAQMSPIQGIITEDVNQDGNLDLIVAGNMYNAEVETPRYDAGNGLLLIGKGDGTFDPVPGHQSGLFASLNVKDIKLVKGPNRSQLLVVANNNGPLQFFKVKQGEAIGQVNQ
jgi:hypothetical protein